MPEFARLTLILLIVCLVSATSLSLTYQATSPKIAENRRKTQEAARLTVLPDAVKVEPADELVIDLKEVPDKEFEALRAFLSDAQEKTKRINVFRGLDEAKKPVGYALQLAAKGFSGDIVIMLGVGLKENGQLVIKGTRVLRHTETPGLGAEMNTVSYEDSQKLGDRATPLFQKQFVTKTKDGVLLAKDGGALDGITAATISSRAFCQGIATGLRLLKEELATGGDSRP